jgi:uncharacterized membrane protein YraQ (UPF0718 family)
MSNENETNWISPILKHKYFNRAFWALGLLASLVGWVKLPIVNTIVAEVNWPPFDPGCKLLSLFCGFFLAIVMGGRIARRIKRWFHRRSYYIHEIAGLRRKITQLAEENAAFKRKISLANKKADVLREELKAFKSKRDKIGVYSRN